MQKAQSDCTCCKTKIIDVDWYKLFILTPPNLYTFNNGDLHLSMILLVTERQQELHTHTVKEPELFLSLKHTSCLVGDARTRKVDCSFGQRLNSTLTLGFFGALKIFQNNSHIVVMGYSSISDHIIYLLKYTSKSHVIVLLGIVSKIMPCTIIFIALLLWHFKLLPSNSSPNQMHAVQASVKKMSWLKPSLLFSIHLLY